MDTEVVDLKEIIEGMRTFKLTMDDCFESSFTMDEFNLSQQTPLNTPSEDENLDYMLVIILQEGPAPFCANLQNVRKMNLKKEVKAYTYQCALPGQRCSSQGVVVTDLVEKEDLCHMITERQVYSCEVCFEQVSKQNPHFWNETNFHSVPGIEYHLRSHQRVPNTMYSFEGHYKSPCNRCIQRRREVERQQKPQLRTNKKFPYVCVGEFAHWQVLSYALSKRDHVEIVPEDFQRQRCHSRINLQVDGLTEEELDQDCAYLCTGCQLWQFPEGMCGHDAIVAARKKSDGNLLDDHLRTLCHQAACLPVKETIELFGIGRLSRAYVNIACREWKGHDPRFDLSWLGEPTYGYVSVRNSDEKEPILILRKERTEAFAIWKKSSKLALNSRDDWKPDESNTAYKRPRTPEKSDDEVIGPAPDGPTRSPGEEWVAFCDRMKEQDAERQAAGHIWSRTSGRPNSEIYSEPEGYNPAADQQLEDTYNMLVASGDIDESANPDFINEPEPYEPLYIRMIKSGEINENGEPIRVSPY